VLVFFDGKVLVLFWWESVGAFLAGKCWCFFGGKVLVLFWRESVGTFLVGKCWCFFGGKVLVFFLAGNLVLVLLGGKTRSVVQMSTRCFVLCKGMQTLWSCLHL